MLRLLEHEIEDVRRLLAGLPTELVEKEVTTKVDTYDIDGEETAQEVCVDVQVEQFSADAIDRQCVADLVERIGAIHDIARARALDEVGRRS